jgi:hypothetical protein
MVLDFEAERINIIVFAEAVNDVDTIPSLLGLSHLFKLLYTLRCHLSLKWHDLLRLWLSHQYNVIADNFFHVRTF